MYLCYQREFQKSKKLQKVQKICFKFLQFEIRNLQTTLDGETIKTKVVDFFEMYNFVVQTLFIWIHLVYQNYVWSSYISKFEFFK